VDRWCNERHVRKGAVVPIQDVWTLTRSWYRERLEFMWRPHTPEAMARMFREAGFSGDFWQI
jgi:hypothetical protein